MYTDCCDSRRSSIDKTLIESLNSRLIEGNWRITISSQGSVLVQMQLTISPGPLQYATYTKMACNIETLGTRRAGHETWERASIGSVQYIMLK